MNHTSRRTRRLRFDLEAAARGSRRGLRSAFRGHRLPQTLVAAAGWLLQTAIITAGIEGLGFARLVAIALFTLASQALLGWYLSLRQRAALRTLRNVVLLEAITVIALALGKLMLALHGPLYLLPWPVFAVALSVGLGLETGLLWTLLATPLLALAAGLQLYRAPVLHEPVLATLAIGSLVAVLAIDRAPRRGRVVAAGLYTGLAQALTILATEFWLAGPAATGQLAGPDPARSWLLVSFGLLNGLFCGYFLVEVGLRLVESAFDVVTGIRLQELADLNQPILKKFALEAPGTFHHSQMVGMLAEAAAEAIGADALLCRVGCHFHDLGKLAKPEYFVENLQGGTSKHTGLTPRMSTLIVLSHVKDGIEMAKELGLPSRVIDFIPEHHGTIAVEYFYRREVERQKEAGGPAVNKDDFRYPGPRPRTRETALVMVADAAEAISRSLDDPSPARIDTMVREVILTRLQDGQFDECGITLAELMRAKDAMVRVLLAAHHGRIKYPRPPDGELAGIGVDTARSGRHEPQG